MELSEFFPFWETLSPEDRAALTQAAVLRSVPAGTLLHSGSADCLGLLAVRSGQLRAFITSAEGREITLYRLFERDICLFSASCIMNSLQFELTISAEKDASFWVIPAAFYQALMERSAPVANYTNQIMATRFSEVLWLMEQILWRRFDQRLARFLLEESVLEESDTLKITHEKIAAHLGTAREVVTRMLKYFQTEGMVRLTRGAVTLTDRGKLTALDAE